MFKHGFGRMTRDWLLGKYDRPGLGPAPRFVWGPQPKATTRRMAAVPPPSGGVADEA